MCSMMPCWGNASRVQILADLQTTRMVRHRGINDGRFTSNYWWLLSSLSFIVMYPKANILQSLLTVLTALACQDAREGFGVRKDNLITDGGNLQKAFFDFWMFQIFYKAVICFNKLAFFTLYLRLFPKLSVRRLCYATIFIFFWRFD